MRHDLLSGLRFRRDPRWLRLRAGEGGRLWQAGGGYDRNLHARRAVARSMGHLHHNPVLAGLAKRAGDYQWPSASWYEGRDGPFRVDGYTG